MINIQNISIQKRLNLFLVGSVILIITFISIFSILYSQGSFSKILDTNMISEMNNLNSLINVEIGEKRQSLETNSKMMSEIFNAYQLKEKEDQTQEINAINFYDNTTIPVKLPYMSLNNKEIYGDTTFVDHMQEITHGTITIDQRVDKGFISVASTIKGANGKRVQDFLIPSDSELGKKFLSKKIFITQQLFLGINYFTAYFPILKNNEVVAIVVIAIEQADMNLLKETFDSKKFLETGYAFLVNKDGQTIIHPDEKKEGTSIADMEFFQTMIHSNQNSGTLNYKYKGQDKLLYYQYNEKMNSYIIVNVLVSEYNSVATKAAIIFTIILIVSIILFLFISRIIVRSIKKPLDACVDFSNEIANGNIMATLPIDQEDELGQLANSLRAMITKLKEVVVAIKGSSEVIVNATQMVNETSQSLSNSATEQASTVEEVSSTMEEMVSAIKENSLNADNTNQISTKASAVMERVFEESHKLTQSVNDITAKITIINDIAMQTNILSLNARVEAAKAGVEGRGFSVVAEEIRNLAEVSKNAADEIIKSSKTSLLIANNTSESINELVPQIKETTDLVSGISAASSQQYNGAEQVNFSMQQVNESIQSNASSSEELSNSAQQLSDEVHKMEQLMSFFKTDKK